MYTTRHTTRPRPGIIILISISSPRIARCARTSRVTRVYIGCKKSGNRFAGKGDAARARARDDREITSSKVIEGGGVARTRSGGLFN